MSRFDNYGCDDEHGIPDEFWYQALGRHLNGPQGQANLRRIRAALDALPEKVLISGTFCDGERVCAVGALVAYARAREGQTWHQVLAELPWDDDGYLLETVRQGKLAGLPRTLAEELANLNDEWWGHLTPEQRWERARKWVLDRIIPAPGEEIR